ncbi:MAG: protein TolQ [Gammaproteobacteria bacterium TMED78]|nr:MAG: protein TolQ [Gammaproteobacteria bacterium TMED78]|tara:strand:+ start:743 stop:1423 length:681 start_codon:yes stop_codon:yes gene_type:complete
MNTDLSILNLILEASFVVQLVMLALLVGSVLSWVVIFEKNKLLSETYSKSKDFEKLFWSGKELEALYNSYKDVEDSDLSGSSIIFKSGYEEFSRLYANKNIATEQMLLSVNRSMRVAHIKVTDNLEKNLSFLATIGSTSPYVGLFGTVWGIMNSFQALGSIQSATLALVAPGIAEALIATAMGLFAAIPAVIAYNRFADQISRIELSFDTFKEEFSIILERHMLVK